MMYHCFDLHRLNDSTINETDNWDEFQETEIWDKAQCLHISLDVKGSVIMLAMILKEP